MLASLVAALLSALCYGVAAVMQAKSGVAELASPLGIDRVAAVRRDERDASQAVGELTPQSFHRPISVFDGS